jgi:putative colanic acid biosynthesis UDP-glucose lipid carrier transferase
LVVAQRLVLAAAECAAFAAAMRFHAAYRVEYYSRLLWPLGLVVRALLAAWWAGAGMVSAFDRHAFYASGDLVPTHLELFALLALARRAAHFAVDAINARQMLRRNVVVIGSGDYAASVIRFLSEAKQQETNNIVGLFDESMKRVSGAGDLGDLVRAKLVDVVMIGLPLTRAHEVSALVAKLHLIPADIVIPFPFAEVGLQPHVARIVNLGEQAGLLVAYRPFKGSAGLLKIFEDYVVASVALVLVSPLLMMAAIAVCV